VPRSGKRGPALDASSKDGHHGNPWASCPASDHPRRPRDGHPALALDLAELGELGVEVDPSGEA
jgi:hypothetical protein